MPRGLRHGDTGVPLVGSEDDSVVAGSVLMPPWPQGLVPGLRQRERCLLPSGAGLHVPVARAPGDGIFCVTDSPAKCHLQDGDCFCPLPSAQHTVDASKSGRLLVSTSEEGR